MRLATIESADGTVAVLESNGSFFPVRDARGEGFADVGALLQRPDWRDLAADATTDAIVEVRRVRPVLSPGAVICVGLNYRSHIEEMEREIPTEPTFFSKLPRALADPDSDLNLPLTSHSVDYEGELVAVIGTGGRDLPRERASEAVAGVTLMNDVTIRDLQWRTVQWFAGKTWESSTPTGPSVVTLDDLTDLGERELVLTVNGEQRQRAWLDDLVFDIPALVADASHFVELRPGDLIATGTPGGVAAAMAEPRWLAEGDVVEVRVDGIGALASTFMEQS